MSADAMDPRIAFDRAFRRIHDEAEERMNRQTKWIDAAVEGARGKGCPKCLVGRSDMMADPGFACDLCAGTGIPHYRALSATEDLYEALKAFMDSDGDIHDKVIAARNAIAKAEGRA